ncbi:DUF1573 domain-containing protein [Planctomycetota bacterium]|nr:DUF1573 domain-containing protein [Planctomycetota bacterium]
MQTHSIIVRVLGLFLIGTGSLKLFTDQSIINLWLIAPIEIIIGGFILLRPKVNATHWTLLILFSTFSLYTLSNILQNNDDCGCLGVISINPWFTLIFDLSILIYLIITKRSIDKNMKLLVPTSIAIVASVLATIIYFQIDKTFNPPEQTTTTTTINTPKITLQKISNPLINTDTENRTKTFFIYDQHCLNCTKIASHPMLDSIESSQAQKYIQNSPNHANKQNRSTLPWLLTNKDTKTEIHLFNLTDQADLDIKHRHLHIGSFTQPQSIDLGIIKTKSQLTIPIYMFNDTNSDIKVKTFRPTCSCIKITCNVKTIAITDYLKFDLTFEAPAKTIDHYQQSIRVRTTNDDIPSINLLLHATIK